MKALLKNAILPLAAAAAAVALLHAGCSIEPVRLGAVLPLTGPQASYGASLQRGILLALDRVNAGGGVGGRRLEVLVRDSASEPERAAVEFERLVGADGVPAVIGGGTTDETLAIAPRAENRRRVLLSPSSSSPAISGAGEWIFRNWPSDEIEGEAMAGFAAFSLHASRVLVLSQDCAYADGLEGVFRARFQSPDRSSEALRFTAGEGAGPGLLDRIRERSTRAQALYLVGYGGDLLLLVRALRIARLDLPMLSVSSLADNSLLRRAGEDLDDVVFPRPEYDPQGDDPAVQEFAAAYRSRFGSEPDIYSAHAYDAVGILAEAMASGGVSAEGVRKGLVQLHAYPGVTGPVTFDPSGDVVRKFQMCVAVRGQAVPLSDAQPDTLSRLQARVQVLRFGR